MREGLVTGTEAGVDLRRLRWSALDADTWRFLHPGSIATRMILFAIVLVTFMAALTGTLLYARLRSAIGSEARIQLTLLARDVAEHLHRELKGRVEEVRAWAHLELMGALRREDADSELTQFFGQTLRGRKVYRAIVCIRKDGVRVAGAGEVGRLEPGEPSTRTRITTVSPGNRPDEGLLQIETPVFDPSETGKTLGTLVVLLDPRRVMDTIDVSVPGAQRASIILHSPSMAVVLARNGFDLPKAPSGSASTRAARLVGVAEVRGIRKTDSPALKVVVSEPKEVALSALSALRATLFKMGLLALMVSSALGALVAWWISLPIRRLTRTVQEITEHGQLSEVGELPRATGEVGVLASSFRAMMGSLADAQQEALKQSRLAFLGEIAANVAHEVRTPLSVLKASTQLLARGDLPVTEQRQVAARATAEVDRLNGVVTGLVDLVHPRPSTRRVESIDEILNRTVAFFSPMVRKSGVKILCAVEDRGLKMACNADQLHQVLLNLIQNALQAMASPGVVTIRARRDGGWIVILVEDNGPGFRPEILPKVFSPFFTTKVDGTGLGLAIAKRIVEEHGGTIAAENTRAGGACLRVRLPMRK